MIKNPLLVGQNQENEKINNLQPLRVITKYVKQKTKKTNKCFKGAVKLTWLHRVGQ